LISAEARAQDAAESSTIELPDLVWSPEWNQVDTQDYVITGGAAAIALAAAIIKPINKRPSHGILFDEAARDVLRQGTTGSRYRARDTSDVLLSLLVTTPFFIDAFITAYWYRGAPDVAYNMAIISAETLAITAAIQGVTNTLVSRERPYGRDCGGALPDDLFDCLGSKRYRSFFSGHSSLAFTGAGLICVHHLRLDLLGGGGRDLAACAVAMAAAATTATLRVVGDVHYASDVITGSLVGALIGLAVPTLHYEFGEEASVSLVPSGNGLSVVGTY
jgi:membrane-associated phospholipid phosphatase